MDDFFKKLEKTDIYREFVTQFGGQWSLQTGKHLQALLGRQGIEVSLEQLKRYLKARPAVAEVKPSEFSESPDRATPSAISPPVNKVSEDSGDLLSDSFLEGAMGASSRPLEEKEKELRAQGQDRVFGDVLSEGVVPSEQVLAAEPVSVDFMNGEGIEEIPSEGAPFQEEREEALVAEPASEGFLETSQQDKERDAEPRKGDGEGLVAEPASDGEEALAAEPASDRFLETGEEYEELTPPGEEYEELTPASQEYEELSDKIVARPPGEAVAVEPISQDFFEMPPSSEEVLEKIKRDQRIESQQEDEFVPESGQGDEIIPESSEPVFQDIAETKAEPAGFKAEYTQALPLPPEEGEALMAEPLSRDFFEAASLDAQYTQALPLPQEAADETLAAEPVSQDFLEIERIPSVFMRPVEASPAGIEEALPQEREEFSPSSAPAAKAPEENVSEVEGSEWDECPETTEDLEKDMTEELENLVREVIVPQEIESPPSDLLSVREEISRAKEQAPQEPQWEGLEEVSQEPQWEELKEAPQEPKIWEDLLGSIPGEEQAPPDRAVEAMQGEGYDQIKEGEDKIAVLTAQAEQFWQERHLPEAINTWSELLGITNIPELHEKISRAEQQMQQARQLWENAQFLADSDKEHDAKIILRECLALYPYHESALRLLAQLEGREAERETRLHDLLIEGERCLAERNFLQAKEIWERGRELVAGEPLRDWLNKTTSLTLHAILSAGKNCVESGAFEQARDVWLQGRELFPQNFQIREELAKTQEKIEELETLCRKAQEYYDDFDLLKADEVITSCLKIAPDYSQAALLQKDIEEARGREMQYRGILQEGESYFVAGDFQKAITSWERALGLIPKEEDLQEKILKAHECMGRLVEQRQEYRERLIEAQDAEAQGNYSEALKIIEKLEGKEWLCETRDLSSDKRRLQEQLVVQQNSQKATEALNKATRSLKRDQIHETREILADEVFEKPIEEATQREYMDLQEKCEKAAQRRYALRRVVAALLIAALGGWQWLAWQIAPSPSSEKTALLDKSGIDARDGKISDETKSPGPDQLRRYQVELSQAVESLERTLKSYENQREARLIACTTGEVQPLTAAKFFVFIGQTIADAKGKVQLAIKRLKEIEASLAELKAQPHQDLKKLLALVDPVLLEKVKDVRHRLQKSQKEQTVQMYKVMELRLSSLHKGNENLEEKAKALAENFSGEEYCQLPDTVSSFVKKAEQSEKELKETLDELSTALENSQEERYGVWIEAAMHITIPSESAYRDAMLALDAVLAYNELKQNFGEVQSSRKKLQEEMKKLEEEYPPNDKYQAIPNDVTSFVSSIEKLENEAKETLKKFFSALKKSETSKYRDYIEKSNAAKKKLPGNRKFTEAMAEIEKVRVANAALKQKKIEEQKRLDQQRDLVKQQKQEWKKRNPDFGKKVLGAWYKEVTGILEQYDKVSRDTIELCDPNSMKAVTELRTRIRNCYKQMKKYPETIEEFEWRLEVLRQGGMNLEQVLLERRRDPNILPGEIRKIEILTTYLRTRKIEIEEMDECLSELSAAKKQLDAEVAAKQVKEETIRALCRFSEQVPRKFKELCQDFDIVIATLEKMRNK